MQGTLGRLKSWLLDPQITAQEVIELTVADLERELTPKIVPDPFTPCARRDCGHRRRCHDNMGCGKYIEARLVWLGSAESIDLAPAHICPCLGFIAP